MRCLQEKCFKYNDEKQKVNGCKKYVCKQEKQKD